MGVSLESGRWLGVKDEIVGPLLLLLTSFNFNPIMDKLKLSNG